MRKSKASEIFPEWMRVEFDLNDPEIARKIANDMIYEDEEGVEQDVLEQIIADIQGIPELRDATAFAIAIARVDPPDGMTEEEFAPHRMAHMAMTLQRIADWWKRGGRGEL